MNRRTIGLARAALSAMHYSGADRCVAPFTRGAGIIFTLRHVRPERADDCGPNRALNVSPEFLDSVVRLVRDRGFDILSLDEMHFRLSDGDLDRPFACFTFDGGYKDNARYAHPIFHKHGFPFAVYVATDFADGRGDLWWAALEKVVCTSQAIEVRMNGTVRRFACATATEKAATFRKIHAWLRRIPEDDARQTVADLCRQNDVDASQICLDLAMDWNEIRELASDPLVTIGAHTRRHYALSGLSLAQARLEIEDSVRRVEAELRRPCRHFSFPYGDEASAGPRDFELVKELGLKTAVTARNELIYARHSAALTALPRVSLNGEFQRAHYVKVMLSGAPFALTHIARWTQPRLPIAWGTAR